jgi:hypothetical protein
VGAVAITAFSIGGVFNARIARAWFGSPAPLAHFEAREGVFELRDLVASVERQQVRARDRIAVEELAKVARPTLTPAPIPAPTSVAAEAPAAPTPADLTALRRYARGLVAEQRAARVRLGAAQIAAERQYSAARRARRADNGIARAASSFVALLVIVGLLWAALHFKQLAIAFIPVVAGAALLLLGLLVADSVSLVAALGLAVVVILIAMQRPNPE